MPEREELTPTEQVRRIVERGDRVWRVYHQAMDEEDAFRDGDRYEDNQDYANRDRRLVQIRGQETEDTIRHMKAVWWQKPRNLQARPIDRMGDPSSAEFMCSLVDYELRNPYKGFEREFYKAVDAARSHRLGIVWQDWHPECGPWGEVFDTEEDARNYMWDPTRHPHHPLSRWLTRKRRLQVEDAREMFNADWLEPDGLGGRQRYGRADQPVMRGGYLMESPAEDDAVTIWECWYKNDKSKKYRENGKELILPTEQRYMSCAGGCGFRSPRQSDLSEPLPEAVDMGCPTCGGNLERIDSLAEQESIYAYSRGKRLVIVAPFSQRDEEPLYDGKWPVPSARSYPILTVFSELRSGRLMGGSDVSRAWDQQIASDQLATMMVQQAFQSQPIYIVPKVGLTDRDNRRFELRDDQERLAFRDDTQEFMQRTIERIDGGQLDSALPAAYQIVQNKLTQYRGVADFGLTDESSKDIPASTVAQITKQEELPSADFVKRTRQELSIYCGIKADYISATYPPQRLVRLNLEGTDQVLEVWGRDMPGFDYEIEDTPDFTGLEKSRVEALQMLESMAQQAMAQQLPIEIIAKKIALYAEEMHFPPSTVRKFQDVLAAMGDFMGQQMAQQNQQAQQQQAMMEDQAAQDMEAGLDVPGMSIGSPEAGMNGGQTAPNMG